MALAGAMSIVSFSLALAEVFTAVGLSTLIPATYIEIARAARKLLDTSDPNSLTAAEIQQALTGIAKFLPVKTDGQNDTALAAKIIQSLLASSDTIDLLLPKSACIEADFTFQGSEKIEEEIGVGAAIDVVNVNAGFSYLYSETSSNHIHLKIDYVMVQEQLAGARFSSTPVSSVASLPTAAPS
jgi:hypothetical protein